MKTPERSEILDAMLGMIDDMEFPSPDESWHFEWRMGRRVFERLLDDPFGTRHAVEVFTVYGVPCYVDPLCPPDRIYLVPVPNKEETRDV